MSVLPSPQHIKRGKHTEFIIIVGFVMANMLDGIFHQEKIDREIIEKLKQGIPYEQLDKNRFRTDDERYIRLNRIANEELNGGK